MANRYEIRITTPDGRSENIPAPGYRQADWSKWVATMTRLQMYPPGTVMQLERLGDDPFEVLGVERSWTKPDGYQNEWWTQVQIERDQEARHGLHDDMYERTD